MGSFFFLDVVFFLFNIGSEKFDLFIILILILGFDVMLVYMASYMMADYGHAHHAF
jgi:hypothetical protein